MSLRLKIDKISSKVMLGLTILSCSVLLLMICGLYFKSRQVLALKPLSQILFSSTWSPANGVFGFFSFIMGTLWVTGAAIVIAVPLCLLTAIYLSEYAHKRVWEITNPLIDLLAGIPSIIYGVWGVLVVVPLIKQYIAPVFGTFTTGYCVLAGGIVLAIMVFPVIIHVTSEVLRTVPLEIRYASLALGATKWQTIKHVVLRKALTGVIAAIVLGLSRAFGETMAVLMVVGNVPKVPKSVFDPAYPLPALIANNYGEMLSIPQYDSALLFSAFLLLIVILLFNIVSRVILIKIERSTQ